MEHEIVKLIGQFKKGKEEAERAFEKLISLYERRIYSFVYRHVGPERAEDVTQEVFVEVYRSLSSFEQRSKFSTWLFGLAYRVCMNRLQREPRTGTTTRMERVSDPPDPSMAAQDPRNRAELTEIIHACLRKLAVPFRSALLLSAVENMTYEEIAEIQRCPVGTVRSRIHLAKLKLYELLKKESPS